MSETVSKAERTKRFIIEKAAPVFNTKGFAGTSINDLMTATGLSKGSIYGNFENKDEVALAVFDYNFGKISAYIKSKTSGMESAVECLLVYPEVFRNFLNMPILQAGCPVLNTATEADDTHPLLKAKTVTALTSWKKTIENHIRRGIERKEIKPGTNPTEMAVVMIAMLEGALMQAKVLNSTNELTIAMDYLEHIISNLKI